MSFGKKSGCDSSVGLRHGVAIDHSSDVTGIARHLLTAHMMSWTRDPVLRVFARVTKYVFVHLRACWKIDMAHHALFESNTTHGLFVTS